MSNTHYFWGVWGLGEQRRGAEGGMKLLKTHKPDHLNESGL